MAMQRRKSGVDGERTSGPARKGPAPHRAGSAPNRRGRPAGKGGVGSKSAGGARKGVIDEGQRLNKVLADAGVASRRAADEMITEGRVKVNGEVVTQLGMRVTANDRIMVDGKLIGDPERHIYILLNKPKDTITTTSDERGRRTVMDLVDSRERIYPVGRLDRNTTGALLLTNDGALANRLMHPRYGVPRLYDVTLDKPLEFRDARSISEGVTLENGEETQPCEISIEDRDRTRLSIILHEGKNREVRRLFEHFGYEVTRLDRKQYAGLTTRGLARGEHRRLDRKEISMLRRLVNLE